MADGSVALDDADNGAVAPTPPTNRDPEPFIAQHRLDDFSRLIADCLWEADADLYLTWISERSAQVVGLPARAIVGRNLVDVLATEQSPELRSVLERHMPLRGTPCRSRSGGHLLLLSAVPVFLPESGAFIGYRGSIAEDRHGPTTRHSPVVDDLVRVFEDCPTPVMVADVDGTVIRVNSRLQALTGCTTADVVGQIAAAFPATRSLHGDEWQAAEAGADGSVGHRTLCLRCADGLPLWQAQTVIPICDSDGRAVCMIGLGEDDASNGHFEERLRHQAHHDALTGLPNRVGFLERLSAAVADARRHRKPVALIAIDIDRFKAITDAVGATGGDEVLRRVATRLTCVFGAADLVGRLAGDEFAAIVANPGDRHEIETRVSVLASCLAEPMAIAGQDLTIHVSIGIATCPHDAEDAFALLQNAATAMQQAKDTGGNTHQFFTPALDDKARTFLAFGQRLRQALPRRQFELHYQPLVELRSGVIVGAEALLRWRHPDLGLVPPGIFIALAEESGLIEGIGAWVFGEALHQVRRWRDQGLSLPNIAVNVSARQLQRGRLRATVVAALEDAGLPPSALSIEITESAVLVDTDAAKTTLDELSRLGVAISVDDFGTGYSWLTYLRQLPLNTLKIDRAFIGDFNTDADTAAIVDAILVMAHRLGLQVVAEGVRNEQQVAILRLKGCEMMQGYYFSPPLTADDFARLLQSGRRLTPMVIAC